MGILSSIYDYIFLKDTDIPQYLNSSSTSSFDEPDDDSIDKYTSKSELYRISESSEGIHDHNFEHDYNEYCDNNNNNESSDGDEEEYDNRIQLILENLKKMDEEYKTVHVNKEYTFSQRVQDIQYHLDLKKMDDDYKTVHVKKEYTFSQRVQDIQYHLKSLEEDLASLYQYVLDTSENVSETDTNTLNTHDPNADVYSEIDLDIDD
jgi:hypothetical protein